MPFRRNKTDTLSWIALSILLSITILVTACSTSTAESTATPVPVASSTEAANGEDSSNLSAEDLLAIVAERTPVPSPTPAIIDRAVEQISVETGIAESSFLGLSGEDWVDFLASLLLGLVLIVVAIFLLLGAVNWAASKTKTRFDDGLLNSIQSELRWLVVVLVVGWAIERLDFLSENLQQLRDDVFFLLITALLTLIAMRVISFSFNWFLEHRIAEANRKRLRPVMMLLTWLGYLFVGLVALSLILAHFGFPTNLLTATIFFGALILAVIGIAARTAIADVVSGFLIMADQPYRGGDLIYINDLNMVGEVVSIGLRSTRILSPDNREVIVPNSLISMNQVVNYSQPDPSFREQIDFLVYGNDFDQLQQLIGETVRGVEGILLEKPVDVIYLSFAGTTMEIRVRWWIKNMDNQFEVRTRVHVALKQALQNAGVDTPDLSFVFNVNKDGT